MYDSETRKSRKSFSLTPIVLIFLGIVFLLNNFGFLPWEIWQNIWKFWPVLLILFGIEILVGRASSFRTLLFLAALVFLLPLILILNPLTGNPLASSELSFEKPLGNLTKAEIFSQLTNNNVKINSLDDSSDKVFKLKVGYSQLLPKPELAEERKFGEVVYTLRQPEKYLPFDSNIGNKVELNLSRLIPISLIFKSNTGVFDLNLENLHIPIIELEAGTAKINITYHKSSNNKTYINSGASQIVLKIPTEVQAEIKLDSSIGNTKINQNRFRKNENTYTTAGFAEATQKLQIEIKGAATSIEVR